MSQDSPKRVREESNSLPLVVLLILVGIICLFLFVGWKYVSDEPSTISELAPTTPEELLKNLPEEGTEAVEDEESTPSENLVTDAQVEKITETAKVAASQPKEAPALPANSQEYTHVVQPNETLFSIATRYNLSMETIKKLNPSVEPNSLKVGVTRLKVPVLAIHTVGPGDVLRVVATKYGVTVEQIMKANGKTKNYAERGEKLVVPIAKRM